MDAVWIFFTFATFFLADDFDFFVVEDVALLSLASTFGDFSFSWSLSEGFDEHHLS